MQRILVEDRRRRQENAGEHAAFYRKLFTEIGEDELAKRFQAQFHLDDDFHQPEIAQSSSIPSLSYKPSFKASRSPNLSIEFVPTNADLKEQKPGSSKKQ
jgi:hypothetical protein